MSITINEMCKYRDQQNYQKAYRKYFLNRKNETGSLFDNLLLMGADMNDKYPNEYKYCDECGIFHPIDNLIYTHDYKICEICLKSQAN